MTPEQRQEVEEAIDEQAMLKQSEKVAGNIVKEEFHKGALFGIKLTLDILGELHGRGD